MDIYLKQLIYNILIMSINIKKKSNELRETVLENIIHMLIDRKFLNNEKKQEYLDHIKTKINSENISVSSDYNHPYTIHVKFLTENNVGKKQNLVNLNKKN